MPQTEKQLVSLVCAAPVIITPRLLPGLLLKDGIISIRRQGRNGEGRDRFEWFIDLEGKGRRRDREFSSVNLRSGVGGCLLQGALASLLGFLGACAEAYASKMRTGSCSDNIDLFAPRVAEWAYQNSDEISMLEHELRTTPELIKEE